MVIYTKDGISLSDKNTYEHHIYDFKFFDLKESVEEVRVYIRDEKINLVKCHIMYLEKIEHFILINSTVDDKIIIKDCKNIILHNNIKSIVENNNSTVDVDNFTGSLDLHNLYSIDLFKYKTCSVLKIKDCKIIYSSWKIKLNMLTIIKPEKLDLRNVEGDYIHIRGKYIVNLANLYNFNIIYLGDISRVICRNKKNFETNNKIIKKIDLSFINILSLKDFDRSICNKFVLFRIKNFRNDNLIDINNITWIKENKYFDYLRSLNSSFIQTKFEKDPEK